MRTNATILLILLFALFNFSIQAQIGTVVSSSKISSWTPGFGTALSTGTAFGQTVTSIGDIDGDGVTDFAVGCPSDNDGGSHRGAVYTILMKSNGTVKAYHKISSLTDMSGLLIDNEWFGAGVCSLGDFDKDGVTDIAVGSPNDNTGGTSRGAFYILYLSKSGTVKSYRKIVTTASAFSGSVTDNARLGMAIDTIGDVDKDGVVDIIVGGPNYRIGGLGAGAVWVVFLNSNGSAKNSQKITQGYGNFSGSVYTNDYFGIGVSGLGDLDGDGVPDAIVGVREDDDGGPNRGSIYILFLKSDGTVKSQQKISSSKGNFTGALLDNDCFGTDITNIGDLDGDGVNDIVATTVDIYTGYQKGEGFVIFLTKAGTVKSYQKFGDKTGNFKDTIVAGDNFGIGVGYIGDFNHDGSKDILVGARCNNDGGFQKGAMYIIHLNRKIAHISTTSSTGFCQGGGATLTADSSAGFTFKWLLNDTIITGATTHTYYGTKSGKYKSIVTYNSIRDTSNTITLTVGTHPVAKISTSNPTIFCMGKYALLKADTGAGYTYTWYLNYSPITGATNSTFMVSSKSGIYKALVGKNGCQDTSNTISITINPLPVAKISTTDPTTFCSGKSALLKADSFAGYSFQWLKAGVIIPNANFDWLRVSKTGDYRVVVANSSCSDTSNHINVIVNSMPVATASTKDSTTFCQGNKATLKADSATGNFFKWLRNGYYYTGGDYSLLRVSTTGQYRVVVYNASCSDTSKGINIVVKPLPVANISTTDPTSFCQGFSALLLADTSIGYSYKWLLNGTLIPGSNLKTIKADKNGKYSALVTMGNCSDTSNLININIYPKPVAKVTTKDSTTFCQGNKASLKADSTTGNSFKWLRNGYYYTGGDYSQLHVFTTGQYRVVVYNGTCSDTSKSINIVVKPIPVANISTTDPTTFCPGLSAELLADSGIGYSYKWLLNGTLIPGSNLKTIKANKAGKYSAIVSMANCADTSQEIVINLYPKPPKPNIIRWGKILYSNSPGGNQWYNMSGPIAGATDTFYRPPANGKYFVIVSNLNGCLSDTSNIIYYVSGIRELSFDDFLQVFPNPNNGTFSVRNTFTDAIKVEIFETSGKMTGSYQIPSGNTLQIDLTEFNTGLFYIKAYMKDGYAIKKLIVY